MVRATSAVGRTRSSISVLMDSTFIAQPPTAPGSDMRCLSRPSLPTVTLSRVDLPRDAIFMTDGLVERLGDAPFDPCPIRWQADGEITIAKCHDRRQQLPSPGVGGFRQIVQTVGGMLR